LLESLPPKGSYSGNWNAHVKDKLENKLHSLVCASQVDDLLEQLKGGPARDCHGLDRGVQEVRGAIAADDRTWIRSVRFTNLG
jgi:hypothetical protein